MKEMNLQCTGALSGEHGSWGKCDFETQFAWALIAWGEMMGLVHPAELHTCHVLFQIVGYRLNTAKYHQSFMFCFRRLLATDWSCLNKAKYYENFVLLRRALATDWIRPSTAWAACFVQGDCWLPTEQDQILPELCVLFQRSLNKTKYYPFFVFCFRRSLANT